MLAKYSKIYDSIIFPNGLKLLVHYFKYKYYILPNWELSCDISNNGFTLQMEANTIKGLVSNVNKMIKGGVDFSKEIIVNKSGVIREYENTI